MSPEDAPADEAVTDDQRRVLRLVIIGSVAITLWTYTGGGNPRTVFALRLGASDGQVGLLNAVPSLILVLQAFCVRWVQRHGKKRILFPSLIGAGVILAGQALAPLAARQWGQPAGVWWLIGTVTLAYLVFVPGQTAWWPLLNDCVPAPIRGRFFARMRTWWLGATVLAMLFLMLWLGKGTEAPLSRYQILLASSVVCPVLVVVFFRKLPESASERGTSYQARSQVWGPVFRDRPFVQFLVGHMLASGLWMLLLVFTAAYMKRGLLYPEWLLIFSHPFAWAIGSAATLWLWGRTVDSSGNRSVFMITLFLYLLTAAGWMFVLSGSVASQVLMGALSLLGGAAWAGYFIAATRQVLLMSPKENQTTYLTSWNIARAVGSAAGPVLAGVALDVLDRYGALPVRPDTLHLNRYTLCFGITALGFAVCLCLFGRLRTPGELGTRQVAAKLFARMAAWR